MTAEQGLEAFRARLDRARELALEDAEERLALATCDRVPAVDARLVRDHEGLLRLFVAIGYASDKKPDPIKWASRYVWELRDVDVILGRVLERRAA